MGMRTQEHRSARSGGSLGGAAAPPYLGGGGVKLRPSLAGASQFEMRPHHSLHTMYVDKPAPVLLAFAGKGELYQFSETISAMGRAALPARDLSELRRRG